MTQTIEARGIRVHNLKNIDVSIPIGKLTVVTGVSGSGKSSLAFDTLYAEGQRRYVECFSTWARQYLDQLPRPDVDRVERIPPAVAIRQHHRNTNSRATVATATEIDEYLRLLFARVGRQFCPECERPVVSHTPEDAVNIVLSWEPGTRFQVCFELSEEPDRAAWFDTLRSEGLQRVIVGGETKRIDDIEQLPDKGRIFVVLDRLKTDSVEAGRLTESIETAMDFADGQCVVLTAGEEGKADAVETTVDGKTWQLHRFFQCPTCDQCHTQFEPITPAALSFNSPRGACPECTGFGSQTTFSFDKVVPNGSLSIREGAIAPWTTPAYEHELAELLALAADYRIPVDVPFRELKPEHLEVIANGAPDWNFGGLRGFFDWLHRHRYKKGVGVFLARWRSFEPCVMCAGTRVSKSARAVRLADRSVADVARLTIPEVLVFLEGLVSHVQSGSAEPSSDPPKGTVTSEVAEPLIAEVRSRLDYLAESGVGYLTLDRSMRTLSAGEAQRVALTAALGSSLVNTLYVLDEPTAGLHATDTRRIIGSVQRLRDAGNTVVVVEHDPDFVRAADQLIDIGPDAGSAGGEVVYHGEVDEFLKGAESATAEWLRTTNRARPNESPREPRGAIRLSGAKTNNLKDLTVDLPLGVLTVVTGVSGGGKSSLIEQTLYPATCRQLGRECSVDQIGTWSKLEGLEQVANVILVDQKPIGRTPRSVPATYLDVFGEIRKVFSQTAEAKKRDFGPGMFSFNSTSGGRCPKCEGAGSVTIDMQFMADVAMTCPECDGARYRPDVLEARYRGLSIADVLRQTADDAFMLFRGQNRLQKKLKVLRDTGLGYLPLGQPATTLSGGEAQRLKIASHLASLASKATRQTKSDKFATLFLLDEPSVGLHGRDVAVLLKCFDALLEAGHSLIVVEHNRDIIAAADHIIDIGPGAGAKGGAIVVTGTPADVAVSKESLTGAMLRGEL